MMRVVQKYGGSSVGTPEKIKRVAQKILKTRKKQTEMVVVVSAMGDTTDEFLALARQVVSEKTMGRVLYERELDMLLTAGERISMALLSMALADLGVEAISFTGSQAGILTTCSHTRARIVEIRPFRVEEELKKGKIVIIAGFQGVSLQKEITTLGRGGSDTTAVALAAALKANRCEIYTDVSGIYSADPRLVPSAFLYPSLSSEVVLEMAAVGAQVMHPRAIEIAREASFPLHIKHAHEETGGTLIVSHAEFMKKEPGLEKPRIYAVTSKKNLREFRIPAADIGKTFQHLSDQNVSVYALELQQGALLRFLIDPEEAPAFAAEHQNYMNMSEVMGLVSLVGYHLQQSVSLPAQVQHVLQENKIPFTRLTTNSQSITLVVPEAAIPAAVTQLHQALVKP